MDNTSPSSEVNTEQRIIEAARQVFLQKGYAGARMQEIADTAGFNKALVHYYFRSKDKLFEVIFKDAIGRLLPAIAHIFHGSEPLVQKIEKFTEAYISIFMEHPYIPMFVLSEMHRNPDDFFKSHISPEMKAGLQQILVLFDEAVKKGEIEPVDPMQLIMHMLSLCIFPFLGRPMLQRMFSISDENFVRLMEERVQSVSKFIIGAITPKIQPL